MAGPTQRARSGTIPSMEVTTDAIKDNTTFIGKPPVHLRLLGSTYPPSLWCIWRLGQEEGVPVIPHHPLSGLLTFRVDLSRLIHSLPQRLAS